MADTSAASEATREPMHQHLNPKPKTPSPNAIVLWRGRVHLLLGFLLLGYRNPQMRRLGV